MKVRDILQKLDMGSSVAESDTDLENYFVVTEPFRKLVMDKGDIVAGEKGTGKTALFRILKKRYKNIPELQNSVEIVTGFNPAGEPIFHQLASGRALAEGQYITIWKGYALSLVGNHILQNNQGNFTRKMKELDRLLKKLGLRSSNSAPDVVFSKLMGMISRLTNPTAAQIAVTLTQEGLPVLVPRVEFGGEPGAESPVSVVRHEDSLGLLNDVLREADLSAWLMLDRLDEAFQGYPHTEIPALRALLRTYLDLQAFDHIKLKLFIRNDLFRRVAQGGFVNLSHISPRRIDIEWEESDLRDVVSRRIKRSSDFISALGLEDASAGQVFDAIFPAKVDSGTRKPKTWDWIIKRISDGNQVKPPRNLIALVQKAQDAQIKREEQVPRDYIRDVAIIEPAAIKQAFEMLSAERVNDTLLAEAGEYGRYIERFRGGKADQDLASIAKTLRVSPQSARDIVRVLVSMGFLQQKRDGYTVPPLYRDGLRITQGKAY